MLVLLVMLGFELSVLAYNMVDPARAKERRDARTQTTMREVRDALIGWSAARTSPADGVNARPGELPCPDINPLDGFEDGNCVSGAIGRVPWRTLGIPEPVDDAGETLWYAVTGTFRIWNTNPNPINSDTKGDLTVFQDSVATTVTTEAAAVIFSAGAPLVTQIRDTTVVVCPTTGTSIPRNACAANYLETAATVNNGNVNGPFIKSKASNTFNDKLLVVTTSDLITVVERRVGQEMRTVLQNYKARTTCACTNLGGTAGCYPWADLSNGYSDADPFNPGEGRNRGRIPTLGAAPFDWGTSPCGSLLSIPSWFVNNDWRRVVYYSAGKNYLGPGACTTCMDATLTLSGASKEVVVFTPGPLLGAAPRAPVPLDDSTYWQYYLSDSANSDLNDVYITPTSTAYARNRVFSIP